MNKEIKFFIVMVLILVGGSLTMIYTQTLSPSKTDSAPSRADFPPPPGGPGRGPRNDIFQNIGLTDFQKDQIGAFRLNSIDASSEYFGTIRKADEQLRMMVDSGAFDVDKAKPLVQAKADAMAAIELIRLSSDAAIQKLLTTEQKTQLAQFNGRRPQGPMGGGFGPPER